MDRLVKQDRIKYILNFIKVILDYADNRSIRE